MRFRDQQRKRVAAVIAAAGEGRRMGGQLEKQFMLLAGRPLLWHTLQTFQISPWIQGVVVAVPKHRVGFVWEDMVRPGGFSKVLEVVEGGAERQESVRRGLCCIGDGWDIVMVHDGARPLITAELIARCVEQTMIWGATVAAVPATDTIKEVDPQGFVDRTHPRERLWMVQTPQTFRYHWIKAAHDRAWREGFSGTDDSSLVERLGVKVRVVKGSYENIKVTTPADLRLAEEILLRRGVPKSWVSE